VYKSNFTESARKNAALTVFALFLLSCIFLLMIGSSFHIAEPTEEYLGISSLASTLEQRTDFLKKLGYSPDADSEEHEEVTIPAAFSDVYRNYNEIQKQSGGDLTRYKGAKCTRYTYRDTESGMMLDLLVLNGRIIGGDKCTYALDGKMEPLGKIEN
jgi:hypothetical protein